MWRQGAITITLRRQLKYYNKSPLHNVNNVKANCKIDEISEGRDSIISIYNFKWRYETGVTAKIKVHKYQSGSLVESRIYLTCNIWVH